MQQEVAATQKPQVLVEVAIFVAEWVGIEGLPQIEQRQQVVGLAQRLVARVAVWDGLENYCWIYQLAPSFSM